MKKIITSTALFCLVAFSVYAMSVLWTVKTDAAKVSFTLPGNGTTGTLTSLKANIEFDEKDLANSKISASVEVKSLNSGDEGKDKHLKSADFFDADKFPLISFASTKIIAAEKGFVATGTLTIKDSVKVIELPFTFDNKGAEGTFQGKFSIECGDYGVTKKGKKVPVDITLEIPVGK